MAPISHIFFVLSDSEDISEIYACHIAQPDHHNPDKNLANIKVSIFQENANIRYQIKLSNTVIFKIDFLPYISDNLQNTTHQISSQSEKTQYTIHTNSSEYQNHSTINGNVGITNQSQIISSKTVISIIIKAFLFVIFYKLILRLLL